MKSRLFSIAICTAALFCGAPAATAQTVNALEYFPLSAGAAATFSQGGTLNSTVVGTPVLVHGPEVPVVATPFIDPYGNRDYYTSDANGVWLHRTESPPMFGDAPGTSDTVAMFRSGGTVGVKLMNATTSVGAVTNINTFARAISGAGLNPSCDSCHAVPLLQMQGTVTVEPPQSVTVPAGNFPDALPLVLSFQLRDANNNLIGTQSSRLWLGKGVGRIKETDLNDGSTVDLTWSSILQPQPPVVFAATLPTSRSVQVGVPATIFATIINSSSTQTATGCRIHPLSSIPATFVYQTTDPATNSLTGTLNTPADIPPTRWQSFVIALTPTGVFGPTDVRFGFTCTNTNVAPINIGLDTLLLSGSTTPVPDVIALGATLKNDGIVDISTTTKLGVFAVAAANVGAGGGISVTAESANPSLPIGLRVCQTDPGSGACLNGVATGNSVTTTINAGGTPTFAIFVDGGGVVPFDPTGNRIFVRFRDGSNVVRGATSVAVRTVP